MGMADAERFEPSSLADWHDWLAGQHERDGGVWVVISKPNSGRVHLTYDALIREALCWGWIDGQSRPFDETRSMLWMTHRRPGSPWSASNKARVADLEREGRLQPAGLAEIEKAKANGLWTVFDSVEALEEPEELAVALDADPVARATWDAYPAGVRKMVLSQIALAKRPETRARRIETYVARAAQGERPV
ncbi:MAG: YdeI/OmpD-associated family protein [Propionicimonas sp.]|uniref:YdeI/OmpD-associated family protein n=1 Tax=Propionicimonas sp. TaxID=1955623 RepID=UPI003D09C9F5